MGTIEALLLIIEWHPKEIHSPPAADGWDSATSMPTGDRRDNLKSNQADTTDDPSARWPGGVRDSSKNVGWHVMDVAWVYSVSSSRVGNL
ncbi:Fc.00g034640.m01.CDS01 [Cosmosporella sp. VM-42]